MTTTTQSPQEKEAIVSEYLLGNWTYQQLGDKYGIHYRVVHSWVIKYMGKKKGDTGVSFKGEENLTENASAEVLFLREELRKEKLRTALLNAIIDIAEKDLKISIRKKHGTKQ